MAARLNRGIAAGVVGIALLAATGCAAHHGCCHKRQPACPAPCPPAGGCCPEAGLPIGGAAPVGVPAITPVPSGPPPATAFSLSPSPGCCGGGMLP